MFFGSLADLRYLFGPRIRSADSQFPLPLSPMKIGPRLLNWALTQGSSLGDTMLVNPRQS